MKLTLTPCKPRNPAALAARQRLAGPHRRSASACRQRAQQALRRELATSAAP